MKILFAKQSSIAALLFFMCANQGIADSLAATSIVHKEKSTIDSFPLQAMEQDDLADAVIAGGLEPTSAGNSEDALTPSLGKQLDLEVRDKQTDLGRSELPITFNYSEPRFVPGVQFVQTTEVTGGRTYHSYDTSISSRP